MCFLPLFLHVLPVSVSPVRGWLPERVGRGQDSVLEVSSFLDGRPLGPREEHEAWAANSETWHRLALSHEGGQYKTRRDSRFGHLMATVVRIGPSPECDLAPLQARFSLQAICAGCIQQVLT